MTRRLKRFVSSLLPHSVSASIAGFIFHIFEGVSLNIHHEVK